MAAQITREERERLSDAYELRYRGEGGPMSSALFSAYLAALVGTVYGSVLAHYVFEEWPQILHWIERQPIFATGIAVVGVLLVAAVAFKVGGARGPVLPEPGHIEFVVATDLPRRLTLRDAWRGSQLMVLTSCLCLGVALPIGFTMAGGSATALVVGVVLGLLGGILIVQSWLRGQVRGHAPLGGMASWPLVEAIPGATMLRQSLLSEAVTSSLIVSDTRRARAQAFSLKLRHKPERIRVAGPHVTVVLADVTGLLRTGWSSLGWLVLELVAVVLVGLNALQNASSPLLLPILVVLTHVGASGLTRGLQGQAAAAGDQSLLGLTWTHEAVLHLAPLAILQFVVATAVGLATGSGGDAAAYGVTIALLVSGGQLLYAHKGPAPGIFMSGPGRGGGVLWAMHPGIVVLAGGFAATLGAGTAVMAGAVVLAIGYSRSSAAFAPARVN
ncbi:hypothetical protein GCM10011492_23440 [Flexivirga endophytica]|uniref:Uncharacterized protein n=1 Tax=Flexivirga endophytica TaxID=1849103 RepID=A0A916T694_9MICO|nr:hypothetical protein [Flexivirga endophytica]GGB32058.1 hypothetical protein GCM10011492_23440 [Flexivirga endophytica]GHB53026.1 hypothetical protein GCM10008112_22720 [Flexivirga endophytica]